MKDAVWWFNERASQEYVPYDLRAEAYWQQLFWFLKWSENCELKNIVKTNVWSTKKKKKKSVQYHISNNIFSKLKNHNLCLVQEVEYKLCACDFFQMGTYYTIMYCQHYVGLTVSKIINNAT